MLNIMELSFDDLTDEEAATVPNNGSGKEYASYIRIYHNGETIGLYSDAMEPEDCTFCRDLRWVAGAIRRAYELGLEDAAKR